MPQSLFGPISQLGYVTDDIETTAKFWTDTSGIGPWTRMPGVTLSALMDGEPTDIEIDVALAYKGDVQIELIKSLNDAPSPYLANKRAGLWGLHHIQFTTDDMAGSLETAKTAGLDVACTIEQGGGIYHYLRGPSTWFELMQPTEGLLALFKMIKDASIDWDGKDYIRDFGL